MCNVSGSMDFSGKLTGEWHRPAAMASLRSKCVKAAGKSAKTGYAGVYPVVSLFHVHRHLPAKES